MENACVVLAALLLCVGADHLSDEYVQFVERGSWNHSVQLDEEFRLSWSRTSDSVIEFLVEAATTGYAGIGFSPKGGMAGADILLGWMDGDVPKLMDCHGSQSNGAPVMDEIQDYELLSGAYNGTHLILRFSRLLDTCDQDDMALGVDTVRIIWAWDLEKPKVRSGQLHGLKWHGQEHRGVKSVHLLSPTRVQKSDVTEDLSTFDIVQKELIIPNNMDTMYWCKIFRAPPLKRKHHIVGYEPIIEPGHEGYVHHMLLYECSSPQPNISVQGAACYSDSMPQEWETCLTPVVAWAVGSEGEFFPEHVGLPFSSNSFFMLETHYNNPNFHKVVDNSGLRLYYTTQVRQYDGGILTTGITVTPLHIIPPHQRGYKTAGYCSSECTEKMIPQTGIKLVSVFLHSHKAGRKLRLRHIRDGAELSRIAEDNHYDFNYQQSRKLSNEISMLPGDELLTECVYETVNRSQPTFGGFSTNEEMCLAFVLYYPKLELASCTSMTPVKYFFETFGIKEFYHLSMDTVEKMFLKLESADNLLPQPVMTSSTSPSFTSLPPGSALDEEVNAQAIAILKQMKGFTEEGVGSGETSPGGLFSELVIREPYEFQNRTFTSHLVELPWAERLLTNPIEERLYKGQHMIFCRKPDDQLATSPTVLEVRNFTQFTTPDSNSTHCLHRIHHASTAVFHSAGNQAMKCVHILVVTTIISRFIGS